MSNLCFWVCVLVINCAVLCMQISETHCDKDSHLTTNIKQEGDGNTLMNRKMHKFHPFLKNVILSDDMVSLLDGLKRRKRVTHHGLRKKNQKLMRINSYSKQNSRYKLKHKVPAISINYFESPVYPRNKILKKHITPKNSFKRTKRIPHHGPRKKVHSILSEYNKESTYESTTTRKNVAVEVHCLESPLLERSQSKRNENKSALSHDPIKDETFYDPPVVLKRRDASPFADVARKLIEHNNNVPELPYSNEISSGKDSNLSSLTPALVEKLAWLTNKLGQTVLKRDAPANPGASDGTSSAESTTAAASTVSGTSDAQTSQSTPGSQNSSIVESTTSPPTTQSSYITKNVSAEGEATLPTNGTNGETNGTCDRDVPCNMGDTLEEILSAVDEIAHEKSAKTAHEDFPCDVNGSWVTEAGGVRLDISVNGNQLSISQYDTVPLKSHPGFLCNDTWVLNGTLPLNNSGILMITGINAHDKRVATFIGECKVCKHKETIAGHWLYVRQARDCSDEKNSYQILSDLWVRESLHTMRKQRLEMIKPGSSQAAAAAKAAKKAQKAESKAAATTTTTTQTPTTVAPK